MRPVSTLVLTATMAALGAPAYAAVMGNEAAVIPHGGWNYPRAATPASSMVAPADPYAPRPDAPIFRLGEAAPVASEAKPRSGADGSRYYSVHRQAGRTPDAPPRPAPIYLDALPVDLTTVPSSDDLAAPPAAPQMIRDANGRLRAVADYQDPT